MGTYRVSNQFADSLQLAVEDAKAHPDRARRVYKLINSLPGKSTAEQQAIVNAYYKSNPTISVGIEDADLEGK